MCAHVPSRVLRSEGPAGGVGRGIGGSVGGGGLNGLVGHDASRELLLSLLETSTGGTIQRVHLDGAEGEPVSEADDFISAAVKNNKLNGHGRQLHLPPRMSNESKMKSLSTYLFKHNERAHRQSGEESSDQQHDDAHWDTGVQTSQGRDPAAGETEDRDRVSRAAGHARAGRSAVSKSIKTVTRFPSR